LIERSSSSALGLASLLGEAHPQQLLSHPVGLEGLVGRRDRGKHPLNRIQGTIGVIGGEVRLMRPAVTDVDELVHIGPLGTAKDPPEISCH
jgi:hypothetical protein